MNDLDNLPDLRSPSLDRDTALRMATTEYERVADLLGSLEPDQWSAPTDCPAWTVRDVAAHMLGMVEMSASIREQLRQTRKARRQRSTGVFIDALTALQVAERVDMAPAQIVDRFAERAPKAVTGRRRTPGFIRRRPMVDPPEVDGETEQWQIGYLVDVILTRDPWMHRIDICRATGAEHVLTAEHDGVLVADVVAEWASRHTQPFTLHLAGPAGGHWSHGHGGPEIELDAIEFTRILSGRAPGTGLLSTQVPF